MRRQPSLFPARNQSIYEYVIYKQYPVQLDAPSSILTINGGSSSIKFAVFRTDESQTQIFSGTLEGIGSVRSKLSYLNHITQETNDSNPHVGDYSVAGTILYNTVKTLGSIEAIGHRVVHGMKHTAPQMITHELLTELRTISVYDTEHLPGEIALIEFFMTHYPKSLHIACFDTSFHATMPEVAKWIPLPRRFKELGVERYGFHGLSYAYLLEELKLIAGEKAANGRIVMAHLGSGASLAAVKNGASIDTSMGFTPTGGLLMSTRTGDLDPGVAFYLLQTEKLNPDQFLHLVNHESGLLGISETSSDMRELLKVQHNDPRAAEAIDVFCYQNKKLVGSYAAALGGIDTLIFSGGIGENSPEVRSGICNDLRFLGIELDEAKNLSNDSVISAATSTVCVRVMKTNEEQMIARLVTGVMETTMNE